MTCLCLDTCACEHRDVWSGKEAQIALFLRALTVKQQLFESSFGLVANMPKCQAFCVLCLYIAKQQSLARNLAQHFMLVVETMEKCILDSR